MERTSPVNAIRQNCLSCAGSKKDVRLCPVSDCLLWPWRLGKRPETVAKANPELLDPDAVRRMGDREAMKELARESGA
jgi:hypothetical protein